MKKSGFTLAGAAIALATVAAPAFTQTVQSKDPCCGQLKTGMVVYVDDNSCGKGKIKRWTGGYGKDSKVKACVPRAEAGLK